MSIRETTNGRSATRRGLVRARTLVAVSAVTALTGVVIIAPAAWGAIPDVPGAPSAAAGNAQITLSVPAATGDPVSSYAATCTADDQTTATGSDTSTTIVVTSGVKNGHSYTCTVIASNSDGDSLPSPASNAVTPTAPATAPGAPAKPSVSAGNAQITVSFNAPADGGSPITGYAAKCTPTTGPARTVNGDSSPITVAPVTNGRTYTCIVVAVNAIDSSPASPDSDPVTPVAPTTVPDAPAAPNVVAGDSLITVTFAAPFNGGRTITSYTVTCTDGNVDLITTVNSVVAVKFGAINGNTYTCTVFATNANGPSPSSNPSNPVTPVPAGHIPGAPTSPAVTAGDSQIRVDFVQPANNGSLISSDTATCTSSNGGASGSNLGGSPSITVFGLTNGKSYTCTVFASNGLGNGPPSPASLTAVPNGTPDAPSRPSVAGGDQRITVNFSPPAFNGGKPITSYRATCTSFDDGTQISLAGNAAPIVITGLFNGVTYSCNVVAHNANGDSDPSPDSQPVVPDRGPDTPARPAVVAGDAQIKVLFTAPGNGGSAIISYGAACTSSNGGHRSTKTGTGSPLLVSGLTNGRTYTCTVAARNARGVSFNSPASAAVVPTGPLSATAVTHGFRLFAGDGGVFTFGTDHNYGSAAGKAQHLVVGMTTTTSEHGYWMVATDGGIFSYGDARFYGSTGAIHLNKPIVGMTPTPTGRGYWLVASDGGIFSYGDAHFFGSTGAIRLNQPIVGMAATPTGRGYWMVASDGGIFSFGDAHFYGSTGGSAIAPVVGMATTRLGHGYWIAAADGSVFHFGDATPLGGATGRVLRLPVRGIVSTRSGRGYWLATGDGGVFTFGDAPFIGWPGPLTLLASIRGVSR